MRKWTIAILLTVLGFLLGAIAAGFFLRPADSQRGPPPSCVGVGVIVANERIASKTAVQSEMLSSVSVPVMLMTGDLIGEDYAPFIAGLPLGSDLRRGDLFRWSDFTPEAILKAVAKPDKADPRKVHDVFTGDHQLPAVPIRSYNAAFRKDEKYFDCLVFLSGPLVLLERIDCVEYTLHKTFPEPHKKICRPEADPNFSLPFSAWGTFDIPVRVTMKDGTQLEWEHGLGF